MAHSRTVMDVSPRALSIPVKLLHAVSGDDTIPTSHETISPDGEAGNTALVITLREQHRGCAMNLSHKTVRQAALTLALSVGLCAASTESYAFSAEAQQMCTGDAFRLCSSEIPNVSRVTTCMMQRRASLSPATIIDRDLAQQSSKAAAQ
jgi:hypothetical protein